MTNHTRFESLAALAIDFELTPAERAELDGHLGTCSACRSIAAGYRADAAALPAIAFVEPPAWVRATVVSTASRGRARYIESWKLIAAAAVLLAALLAAAVAIGAFDRRPTIVEVPPIPTPSPVRTVVPSARPSDLLVAQPSNDASAEPAEYTPPTPVCPAPATAPAVPDVTVSVGTAPGRKATFWGAGIRTCSTTGTDDGVPSPPTAIVSAKTGDRFTLALPTSWSFLHVEPTDSATTSNAVAQPAIEATDRPSRIEVPVTAGPGESIVGFDIWIISDDQRVVVGLSVGIRVNVGGTAPSPTPAPLPNVSVPLRWTRVADQPSFADSTMTAVVAGRDRYVAVGCATTAGRSRSMPVPGRAGCPRMA